MGERKRLCSRHRWARIKNLRLLGMSRRYTQEQILQAIKGSGAIITTIASRLDCAWSTAQSYVLKWETTRRAMGDETELVKDLAESTLITSIKQGDTTSAKWYLSKKAKDRGYGDELTAQQTNPAAEDTELTINIIDGVQNED